MSPHHTMPRGDVGGRVTDCAGSSVAAEWPDPEGDDGVPIPVRRLRLNLRNWVAVATANGQACAEWATRGDERRNTAAHGHGISLGAFRTSLVLGVDEAGSVSWRSRARRLVARRLGGLKRAVSRGRVTDCAGSSVAAEWPDPERPVAIRSQSGGCACVHETGWLSPLQMAKRAQSGRREETRGDERRNTAAHGHGISLGAFRTALVLGVDEAGSVSWRSRARRLVGSAVRRLDGQCRKQNLAVD